MVASGHSGDSSHRHHARHYLISGMEGGKEESGNGGTSTDKNRFVINSSMKPLIVNLEMMNSWPPLSGTLQHSP
jgi:hypothetical protein